MKAKLLLTLILFSFGSLFAQQFVKGQIVTKEKGEALLSANVMVLNLADSSMRGTTTDNKGVFTINNLKNGRYKITVSFIGYTKYQNTFEIRNKSVDLEKITLTEENFQTNDVEVTAKVERVVVKQDTTEYNSTAFKTNKDATAEDLLTKIPGVQVQNGKVQAQGEDVKRVLVDGKPFFGEDPSAALKNVPAEVVERIQVFDQQSEQAQFTGFNDGNTTKAVNLITRMGRAQGTFGKITAGYGDDSKYKSSGNLNFFEGDRRISFLGMINNINEQNFSMDDIGSMSGGGGGMRGGGGGMMFMGGGGGQAPGGMTFRGGLSDFMVSASNGLINTKAMGINYSNKWGETVEMTGSYFFNYSGNNAISQTDRQNFLLNGSQNYAENSLAKTNNYNHRFNLRFEYKFDENNSLLFRPRVTVTQNDGGTNTKGQTSVGSTLLNSISNLFDSKLQSLSISSELLYRHKFATPGRTISIELENDINNRDGDYNLFSLSKFYSAMMSADTTDQISNLVTDGYKVTGNVTYTEPLDQYNFLQFTLESSYGKDNSDQNTFREFLQTGQYTVLDTTLSNLYDKISKRQSIGAGYRYNKDDLSVFANLNYNYSTLGNDQKFPFISTMERNFNSITPFVMVRYKISQTQNFRLTYRGNNNEPSTTQLQNVLNNTNPIQLSIGNPNLKQDQSHFLMAHYSSINMQSLNSFFIFLMANFSQDYIGNKTIIAEKDTMLANDIFLKRGSQLSTYENMNGNYSLRTFFTYGIPVWFLKSNLNLNAGISYSRVPGLINNQTNYSNNQGLNLGFTLATNISKEFDVTLSSMINYTKVKNTIRSSSDNNYYTLNNYMKFYWQFWEGFLVQFDARHQYDSGLPEEYKQNNVLLNIGIGKKLFDKDQGEIRLAVYDLLNKNTNIRRTVADSYIADTRSNIIGRYVMLQFSYSLRAFN